MSFELAQLREAADKYAYHDAGTHGVWPRLVCERRNEPPVARLDDAVEFLGKWKALRFKGWKIAFRRICKTGLRKNLADLQRLQGRVLYSLALRTFRLSSRSVRASETGGAAKTTFDYALEVVAATLCSLSTRRILHTS
jgi:hypothetical protein